MPSAPAKEKAAKTVEKTDSPWQIVVLDDPVNYMGYVTQVFIKVFAYPRPKAEHHMIEVHEKGKSIVWSGKREQAEVYLQQLQQALLKAFLQKQE